MQFKNVYKNKKILITGLSGFKGTWLAFWLNLLGAKVTGIDFVKANIDTAKYHAKNSNLKINYIHTNLENFDSKRKYDLILMLEIIEHLDNWEEVINKIKKNLSNNGTLILSTINRTQIANFFAYFLPSDQPI